jgi:hypothetical protein
MMFNTKEGESDRKTTSTLQIGAEYSTKLERRQSLIMARIILGLGDKPKL